jgi:GTPase SAR1 family protein
MPDPKQPDWDAHNLRYAAEQAARAETDDEEWKPDETAFDLMSPGREGFYRPTQPYRQAVNDDALEAAKAVSLAGSEPLGTELEDSPPYFLGPLIRPADSVMIVGQPGSGKSSIMADVIVGSYDTNNPTALAGAWKIDQRFHFGKTFIFNGETTPKKDWASMLHKALIGRGLSPKDEVGAMMCNELIFWIDPAREAMGLDSPDSSREARVLRLADELYKNGASLVVMDPLFAIFGAAENADNSWIFHSLNPFIKALKERQITTVMITHPSGVAEASKSSLKQQFSPYGSKQQLAIIDCHIGVKRDGQDRILVYNRKSRRADWIRDNNPLKLIKNHPAGYLGAEGSDMWLHESPEVIPLPNDALDLMKALPNSEVPFRKPDRVEKRRMKRLFEGWLKPFGLLTMERLDHEPGQPYEFCWTPKGLIERRKLGGP